jgi:hypothetical protein
MHRRTFDKCSILTPAQKRRLKGLSGAGTYSVPDIILHVPSAGKGLADHIHIYCGNQVLLGHKPKPDKCSGHGGTARRTHCELQKARRQA